MAALRSRGSRPKSVERWATSTVSVVGPDACDYFFGLMSRYGRYPMNLEGLEALL